MFTAVIPTPFCQLGILIENNAITKLLFLEKNHPLQSSDHTLVAQLRQEVEAYFKNPAHIFQTQFELKGTPFQKAVWQALAAIPLGTTVTYGELAKQLQTSPRAIGNACRANPIPLIIPCHRVTSKQHLGGFVGNRQGEMIHLKQQLLQHEKALGSIDQHSRIVNRL